MGLFLTNLKTSIMMRMCKVKPERKESGDHLVEVLGTIVVAVVLLIIFQDYVKELFDNIMDKVSGVIDDMFDFTSEQPSE